MRTVNWLFATGIYLVISGVVMMNRWYHSFGDAGMLIFFAIHIIAIFVCIALMSAVIRQLIRMYRQ